MGDVSRQKRQVFRYDVWRGNYSFTCNLCERKFDFRNDEDREVAVRDHRIICPRKRL